MALYCGILLGKHILTEGGRKLGNGGEGVDVGWFAHGGGLLVARMDESRRTRFVIVNSLRVGGAMVKLAGGEVR